MKDIAIKELRRKLKVALKEKAGIQLIIEKLENASKSLNRLIDSQIMDNCKKGLGYNAVPPSHTRLFIPPKHDLSYISLEEFTYEPAKSDDEDESVPQPKIEKKTIKPSVAKLKVNAARHNLPLLVSIKRNLKFVDEGRVNCLPNKVIFKQLTLMSMVKHLDSGNKFLMYPRFVQVFLNNQLGEMENHIRIYVAPYYTKKIFGNMKRVEKEFSRRVTSLFPTIIVQAQEEMGEESVVNEAVNEEMDDNLERDTTTTTSLDAECKEAIGDTSAHTRYERVSKISNDQLLIGVNIPQSGEDSLKRIELMKICTTLQKKVLDLEDELKRTKTAQQTMINGFKRRVKKLEKKHKSRTHKLKRLYKYSLTAKVISSSEKEDLGEENAFKQERIINDIDADEDITHVNDQEMFDADKDLQGEEVVVEQEVVADKERSVDAAHVSAAATTVTIDNITLAKTLEDIKTSKPKIRGIVIKDHEEPKPVKLKKKDQILFDEEATRKIQEEINEQERLAKLDADYELAERMQAKEQQKLNEEEKAKLFMDLLKKRRKFSNAKRAEEKRNRRPTNAQKRSLMCTYLKNMDGWKPRALMNKSFAKLQELFYKAMKKINTFVDFRTELVEESSKKAKAEITQKESSKGARDELE
nr:hypothetical protein [Tanacetum cinerariifolium]